MNTQNIKRTSLVKSLPKQNAAGPNGYGYQVQRSTEAKSGTTVFSWFLATKEADFSPFRLVILIVLESEYSLV